MEMVGRAFIGIAAFLACALHVSAAGAQTWPHRPISITVTFPPGGSADLTARVIAEKISKALGQPVIVENKPGASGEIGVSSVVRARPDGYSFVVTTNSPISVTRNFKSMPYDVATDIVPVAMLVKVPLAIAVKASLPIHDVKEVVEVSKIKADGLSLGIPGIGSYAHLAGEIFRVKTGANLVAVPYKGMSAIAAALKAGELDLAIADLTTLAPMASDDAIRFIGLIDATRSARAPNIPTINESGVPEFRLTAWICMFAPKGTPPALVARVNEVINDALAQPDVKQRLEGAGVDPWIVPGDQLPKLIKDDVTHWTESLKGTNVKLEGN